MPTATPTCLLCTALITDDNDSAEHVLTNAVGGRLKVRGLVCKPCNDRTGHDWDAVLADQLHALCLLIGVARERGETPPLTVKTTTGQVLKLTAADGLHLPKPSYEEVQTEAGVQIRLSARTMAEARRMIEGAKAKYPQIDVEASLAQAQQQWSAPDGYMHHSFYVGGFQAGRSIVKSAMVFAVHAGVSPDSLGSALDFLRDTADVTPPIGWYYATDVVAGRPPKTPLTCVGVHGNSQTGLVLGYVEYFGFHRAIVELGRDYAGPEVRASYGFDPRTGEEVELDVILPFDADELAAIFEYQRIPEGSQEAALREVLPQALARQVESEQERVFGSAVRYALERTGLKPGDEITPEYAQQIAADVTQYVTPWIAHRLAQQRRPTPPLPCPWRLDGEAEAG
ncbi:MAG: HNH endonuclease [Caulobacteraceae bacterium]